MLVGAAAAVAALAAALIAERTGGKGDRADAHVAVPGPHGLAALGSGVAAALFDAGAVVRVGTNGRILYRVPVGPHPTNPVVQGAALWVPVVGAHRLVEIRASSGTVERRLHGTYAAAVAGPHGSLLLSTWPDAPAEPDLWRGHSVTRLETSTGRVAWRRSFQGIVLPLAYAAGRVWVPDFAGSTIRILRAADGSTISEVRLPGRPVAVAVGGSCAWIALADGPLLQLEPTTLRIRGRTPLHGDNVDYMVARDNGVWLTRYSSPTAAVVEHVSCASGLVDGSRSVAGASQGLAVDSNHLWLADYGKGRILRLAKP